MAQEKRHKKESVTITEESKKSGRVDPSRILGRTVWERVVLPPEKKKSIESGPLVNQQISRLVWYPGYRNHKKIQPTPCVSCTRIR